MRILSEVGESDWPDEEKKGKSRQFEVQEKVEEKYLQQVESFLAKMKPFHDHVVHISSEYFTREGDTRVQTSKRPDCGAERRNPEEL